MAVTELVPVEERRVGTNAGERDYSLLQYRIAKLLDQRGLIVFTRPHVQMAAGHFRIPDVAAER